MRRLSPALALAALLAACDTLGLGKNNLEGTWLYSAQNVNSPNIHCAISQVVLNIRQDGERFSGTTSGGHINCRFLRNDSLFTHQFPPEPIVEGRIIGDSVTFLIGSADWVNSGRIEGRAMSGTTRLLAGPLFGGTLYAGYFGAVRTDTIRIR